MEATKDPKRQARFFTAPRNETERDILRRNRRAFQLYVACGLLVGFLVVLAMIRHWH